MKKGDNPSNPGGSVKRGEGRGKGEGQRARTDNPAIRAATRRTGKARGEAKRNPGMPVPQGPALTGRTEAPFAAFSSCAPSERPGGARVVCGLCPQGCTLGSHRWPPWGRRSHSWRAGRSGTVTMRAGGLPDCPCVTPAAGGTFPATKGDGRLCLFNPTAVQFIVGTTGKTMFAAAKQKPGQVVRATRFLWAGLVLSGSSLYMDHRLTLQSAPTLGELMETCLIFVFWSLLILKVSTGRNWARITYLILTILSLPLYVPIVRIDFNTHAALGLSTAASVVLPILGLWLLFTSPGKRWFQGSRL